MDNLKMDVIFKIFFLVLISSFLLSLKSVAAEEDVPLVDEENIQEEVMEQLHTDEVEMFWQQLRESYGPYVDELQTKSIKDLIKSEEKFSLSNFVKGLLAYLFHEVLVNGKLLGTLILLTICATVLQTMLNAFEKSTVQQVARFVVVTVLFLLTLQSFYLAISYAKDAIQLMSDFIIALFPLLLGIIASLGQFTQVAFFHPIIIFLIHMSGLLLSRFVFPLLYVAALLMFVSELNKRFQVTHLAQLIRTISLGGLGLYLGVFLTVLSIQGAASAVQDGVALKTTKFIASNFIPVIGQTVTDAADTILSASLLLKNSLGIVGLLIIVLFAIFPAIKIGVIAFIYKLVASLMQLLAPKETVQILHTMSQYTMYVLACLIGMTFMFFLTIVIIVAASNIPILLR